MAQNSNTRCRAIGTQMGEKVSDNWAPGTLKLVGKQLYPLLLAAQQDQPCVSRQVQPCLLSSF